MKVETDEGFTINVTEIGHSKRAFCHGVWSLWSDCQVSGPIDVMDQ